MECSFRSDVLNFDQQVSVLLPEPKVLRLAERGQADVAPLPVLYLLHGYTDNHLGWLRRTGVERYLEDSGLRMIVVLPSMKDYYYTDMAYGWPYFTYIAEELPLIMRTMFHISPAREDTFVAGLSMGGYGAMKLALTYPERYAAAASFSGVTDAMQYSLDSVPERHPIFYNIFGHEDARFGSQNDTMHLLDACRSSGKPLPKLYQSVGLDDTVFYKYNPPFRDKAWALGYDLTYFEQPGMGHEWAFWDSEVQKLFDWLPVRGG
nr:alpha/beta hydrolase family protein [Maliibacterium massiliense]